jgi:class 3 adenylate cyclase
MDYSAIGETTHLAARMAQLAPPGTIRRATATLRLVEGFMRVKALGLVPDGWPAGAGSRRVLYRAREMTFWLPQAQAALAHGMARHRRK